MGTLQPAVLSASAGYLGKYRLLESIGRGGSAEVYRAMRLEGGEEHPVVLKCVLPQLASDPSYAQLFHEEARVVANLDHPNIVRLLDHGELRGRPFLALEYVDGYSLEELLCGRDGKPRCVDPSLAAWIAAHLAGALAYVHRRTDADGRPLEIVHRDVSPQNVLISRDGKVKLTDFGISKSAFHAEPTEVGVVKGKFDYIAPEQAGGGGRVGPGTDVFALGAVLHEMLFGRTPFRGSSGVETLNRVLCNTFTLRADWLPEQHRALIAIIKRCLEPSPLDRYPSADDLRIELQHYLSSLLTPVTRTAVSLWLARFEETRETRVIADPGDSIPDLSGSPPIDNVALRLLGEGTSSRETAVHARRIVSEAEPLLVPNQVPMVTAVVSTVAAPDRSSGPAVDAKTEVATPPGKPKGRRRSPHRLRVLRTVGLIVLTAGITAYTTRAIILSSRARSAVEAAREGDSTARLPSATVAPAGPAPASRDEEAQNSESEDEARTAVAGGIPPVASGIGPTSVEGPEAPFEDPQASAEERLPATEGSAAPVVDLPAPVEEGPPPAIEEPPASVGGLLPATEESPTPIERIAQLPDRTSPVPGRDTARNTSREGAVANAPPPAPTKRSDKTGRRAKSRRAVRRRTNALSRRAKRHRSSFGFITVNSIPWARVIVDGREIGKTPMRRRRLPAGEHEVRLVGADGRTLTVFGARVRAGQVHVHSFDENKP